MEPGDEAENIADAAAAIQALSNVFGTIGFTEAHRLRIIQDNFSRGLIDFISFKESDIDDMAKDYSSRRTQIERIHFGVIKMKRLKGVMHHIQDLERIGAPTVPDNITLEAMELANARVAERKKFEGNMDSATKTTCPGKFENTKTWHQWKQGFANYLSVIPGITGIPLSYVIRKNERQDHEGEFNGD